VIKTVACIDCRVEFSLDYRTGPPRQRCEPCREERRKARNREKSQRWKEANRAHHVAYLRQYHQDRKDDPEYRRARREGMVFYKFGITQAELVALDAAQNGRCAICGGPPNGPGTRLHIDHCHNSKKIRGLLCSKCNTAVGLLDDSPERAEQLAAYLRR
jgi:hypothetical protein